MFNFTLNLAQYSSCICKFFEFLLIQNFSIQSFSIQYGKTNSIWNDLAEGGCCFCVCVLLLIILPYFLYLCVFQKFGYFLSYWSCNELFDTNMWVAAEKHCVFSRKMATSQHLFVELCFLIFGLVNISGSNIIPSCPALCECLGNIVDCSASQITYLPENISQYPWIEELWVSSLAPTTHVSWEHYLTLQ